MEGVWQVSFGCLEGVLRVSGRCLNGVWRESMGCLNGILVSQDRSSQDNTFVYLCIFLFTFVSLC